MKIVEFARQFIGQKEVGKNTFDSKTPLGAMIHAAGQLDGEAWCCYFAEGCAVGAYPWAEARIRKEFSANSVQCFKNLVDAGHRVSAFPVPGAICFMQHYENGVPTTNGHTYIVEKNLNTAFTQHATIEGNSTQQGTREGDIVANNSRKVQFEPDGLTTLGFIVLNYPKTE